jgi:hypothetical protein
MLRISSRMTAVPGLTINAETEGTAVHRAELRLTHCGQPHWLQPPYSLIGSVFASFIFDVQIAKGG